MTTAAARVRCLHCGHRWAATPRNLCRTCVAVRSVRDRFPVVAEPPKKRPPCRHCRGRYSCRPRGLCWPCFGDPAVRALYPTSAAPTSRRGVGNGVMASAPPPSEPTDAVPGTPEKIEVLSARAARGESLWHPGDAGGGVSVLGILRAIREGAA